MSNEFFFFEKNFVLKDKNNFEKINIYIKRRENKI